MRKSAFRTPFLIIAILGGLALVSLRCVEAPDAPVRDNPFQGDPFELSATLTAEGVVLTWKAVSVSGLTGYKVYRSLNADSGFVSKGTLPTSTLQFTDGDIFSDSTYFYKVAALVGGSESASSATESVQITGARVCVSDTAWVASDTGSTSPGINISNCNNAGILGWTAIEDIEWLTISHDSGNTPTTLTITADSNTTGSLRSGVITVRSTCLDSTTTTISVSQPTTGSELCISVSVWPAPDTGGTSAVVEITNCGNASTFAWSASTGADWLSLSDSAGMAPGSFAITADSNLTGAIREDTVTVTAPGVDGSLSQIVVAQSSIEAMLCVSDDSWEAPMFGGTSDDIMVTNCSNNTSLVWDVASNSSWITVDASGGTTPGVFTITTEANSASASRSGSITVSSVGTAGSPIVVSVNQEPSFAIAVSYGVGVSPRSVFSIDFNGDGHNDLATANRNSNTVSILLGNGDGTFQSAVNYAAGDAPVSVFSIGLNSDGHNDLATANEYSDNVSILLGNGDGTFQSAVNYAVGDVPYSVSSIDFDTDGHNDLATANGYTDNVSILLGNGDGTFQSAVNYAAGDDPRSILSIDLNSDGHHDLATANVGSDNVSILLGNGDGTFQSAMNHAAGDDPRSILSIDLNSDGHNDLATANSSSDDVSILLGNGDGAFQSAVGYTVEYGTRSVFSIDLNSDGHNDLATANYSSENVSILLGNGDGTFQSAVNYAAGERPSSVFSIDFDGDGDNDLAVANSESDDVSILINNTVR